MIKRGYNYEYFVLLRSYLQLYLIEYQRSLAKCFHLLYQEVCHILLLSPSKFFNVCLLKLIFNYLMLNSTFIFYSSSLPSKSNSSTALSKFKWVTYSKIISKAWRTNNYLFFNAWKWKMLNFKFIYLSRELVLRFKRVIITFFRFFALICLSKNSIQLYFLLF